MAHLLARDSFKGLAPHKGRFRSFLLASLKHFLADEWDKLRAQKRGGGISPISLDAERAEKCYAREPTDERDPERLFERRWALTLIDQVLSKVGSEMIHAGKEVRWRELQSCLLGDSPSLSYAEIADRLGITESAVKMSVLRLRQRFREILRMDIAETVATEADVEDEMNHLFTVLSR